MKKLAMALMLTLLLCGCARQTSPTETTLPPVETTVSAEPTESFYVSGSTMERGTGGAVRLYQMDGSVIGIGRMGENLVAFDSSQTLYLLSGDNLEVQRERQLENSITWSQISLTISENGMAYYDADANSYVILDSNLVTASVVSFQEPLLTEPVISPDFTTIYYVAESGIRAMDVGNGTSRRLREEASPILSLDGLLFDGGVLSYSRQIGEDGSQTCFIDAENGSLCYTAEFQGQLVSSGNEFSGVMKLEHSLGQCKWVVVGDLEGKLQMLQPREQWESQIFPGEDLVVLQHESQVGLTLYCYNLDTGVLVSQITMPEQYNNFAYGCTDGTKIWLCDGASGRFYCWDTQRSGKGDDTDFLEDYASLAQPDQEGMNNCLRQAEKLSEQYGVKITFTQDGNRMEGVDYSGYPDYQPDLYSDALTLLEKTLKKFPDGFLQKMGKATKAGKLEIRLVDNFDPSLPIPEGTGSVDLQDGAQALLVSMCPDLEAIFCHELFHLMDTEINNSGDDLKNWSDLNPEGFEYTGSFAAYESGVLDDSEHLAFGSNYFADACGLVSPREDRAQIFLYAMMEDQQERFASDGMQTKLSRLCQLIRKIYKLDDSQQLLWEQYLLPEE